jgi:hypothetical protein
MEQRPKINSTRSPERTSEMASQPLTLRITWFLEPSKAPNSTTPCARRTELVQEKECVYFNAFEIQGKPRVIRLVEIWDCDLAHVQEVDIFPRVLEDEMSRCPWCVVSVEERTHTGHQLLSLFRRLSWSRDCRRL